MKFTIELNDNCGDYSDSPRDIEVYTKAMDLALALNEFSNKIRNWTKYDERNEIPVDEIHGSFYEVLNDYGINLDRLIR